MLYVSFYSVVEAVGGGVTVFGGLTSCISISSVIFRLPLIDSKLPGGLSQTQEYRKNVTGLKMRKYI